MVHSRVRKGHIFLMMMLLTLGGLLFAGSTLATDETAIKAVLPGVDLQVYDKATGSYSSMLGTSGAKAFDADLIWCPGATHIAYIRVDNRVDVDVEFSLVLDAAFSIAGFGDYLTYAVMPLTDPSAMTYTNWTDFAANAQRTGTLVDNSPTF